MVMNLNIHRGIYMSAHALLNLLKKFGKAIKCESANQFISFSHKV